VPIAPRTLAIFSVLVLLSIGLAVAFIALWPRPASLMFATIALLCDFSALLVVSNSAGRTHTLMARKAIFLVSGCFGLALIGLAWKYRAIAPAFSLASLIAVALLCLGSLGTYFIVRSIQARID